MRKNPINLNTVLLLVVLAGLIVLYILFFTSRPSGNSEPGSGDSTEMAALTQPRVVFVNIDTLNEHYEFVKLLKENLENTGNRLQGEILREQQALEKDAADLQSKYESGRITQSEAQQRYEKLMMDQQALMDKKERYTQQVAEQEYKMNIELLDTVDSFLRRFNQQYGYDYILAYRTAGEILIASDKLDITQQVLGQLNQEYAARNQ